jgi:hypothetical protein
VIANTTGRKLKAKVPQYISDIAHRMANWTGLNLEQVD